MCVCARACVCVRERERNSNSRAMIQMAENKHALFVLDTVVLEFRVTDTHDHAEESRGSSFK